GTRYTSSVGLATWKLDRFVSVDGPAEGGMLTTVPVVFSGNRLELNYAAMPSGGVKVELLDLEGKVLLESELLIGDELRRTVTWTAGAGLADLVGRPIVLRFQL